MILLLLGVPLQAVPHVLRSKTLASTNTYITIEEMSSPDPSFYTKVATEKAALLDADTSYKDSMQKLASQRGSILETGELSEEESSLHARLRDMKSANETYDREYQDRVNAGIIQTSPKLQTTQDIVLAAFFGSYLILIFLVFIYILRFTKLKMINSISFLVIALTIGLITAYVIMQLA